MSEQQATELGLQATPRGAVDLAPLNEAYAPLVALEERQAIIRRSACGRWRVTIVTGFLPAGARRPASGWSSRHFIAPEPVDCERWARRKAFVAINRVGRRKQITVTATDILQSDQPTEAPQ